MDVSRKRKQPDEEERTEETVARIEPLEDIDDNDQEYDDSDDDSEDEQQRGEYFKLSRVLKHQESGTGSKDGDIKVTPFNLTEEMEDGRFDEHGNFMFEKSDDDDKDNKDTWAESVDWDEVERRQKDNNEQSQPQSQPSTSLPVPVLDPYSCYREMLRIMRPDETVQKTIRRLGNSIPKKRPSKSKLSKAADHAGLDPIVIAEAKKKLDRLIELSHQRVEAGDSDIYQKSYDDLEEAMNL